MLADSEGAQLEADILHKYERRRREQNLPARGLIPFDDTTKSIDPEKWSQDEEMDYQRTRLAKLERDHVGGLLKNEESKNKLFRIYWFMIYELKQRADRRKLRTSSGKLAKLKKSASGLLPLASSQSFDINMDVTTRKLHDSDPESEIQTARVLGLPFATEVSSTPRKSMIQ
eukprot:SAG31_NODE_2437_length_5696_cov_2.259067_6_plen_172_part_00